jgi:hypothetical protein
MDYTDYFNSILKDTKSGKTEKSDFLKMVDEVLGTKDEFLDPNIKINPITNEPDLTEQEKELVNKIVKTFDGYDYDTKKDKDTVTIVFNQSPCADLVKKWAEVFPNNEFKGIKLEIVIKKG